MNTYSKYCPNVYLAKCTEAHEKGEVIIVTTKYGKENESIIHNLIKKDSDGNHYYSTNWDFFLFLVGVLSFWYLRKFHLISFIDCANQWIRCSISNYMLMEHALDLPNQRTRFLEAILYMVSLIIFGM